MEHGCWLIHCAGASQWVCRCGWNSERWFGASVVASKAVLEQMRHHRTGLTSGVAVPSRLYGDLPGIILVDDPDYGGDWQHLETGDILTVTRDIARSV